MSGHGKIIFSVVVEKNVKIVEKYLKIYYFKTLLKFLVARKSSGIF